MNLPSNEQSANLFAKISSNNKQEIIEVLMRSENVRIERIVSRGHSSPEDFWYDQAENEWVVVLAGSGTLELKDPDEIVQLGIGEYIYIPAHRQHRVRSTAADTETIWLAVFFQE
ncbi:cupin domain-containing protein [Planctomicrobium sp.]|nr:cupin domain-containing protein [Planctomicrobium sp.]